MRILITGAFGYLGGRVSSFFSSIPDHEIILASSRNVKTSYLPKHIKFIQGEHLIVLVQLLHLDHSYQQQ